MTTYATPNDLKAAIHPDDLALLTDWIGSADTADDTKLQAALDDATAEIDSYISKRVSLPMENPPRMLLVACRDLAMFRLYANVGRITDAQTNLRDASIQYLKAVSRGDLAMGDETPGDEVQSSPGVVIAEGPPRVMTRDSLKGF